MAEFACRRYKRMRRTDLIGKVVGVAAAAGGKDDDGGDVGRIGIGKRQRTPSPGLRRVIWGCNGVARRVRR